MVVPKRRESLSELARQFQRRQIEKEYTAIVWGEVAEDRGSIELPIATDWPNRPKQIICEERGKHALTHFEVLKRSNNRSLIKLKPVTGRSHQLRIHMQSLGHPIIGCDMYAHPEALESFRSSATSCDATKVVRALNRQLAFSLFPDTV